MKVPGSDRAQSPVTISILSLWPQQGGCESCACSSVLERFASALVTVPEKKRARCGSSPCTSNGFMVLPNCASVVARCGPVWLGFLRSPFPWNWA